MQSMCRPSGVAFCKPWLLHLSYQSSILSMCLNVLQHGCYLCRSLLWKQTTQHDLNCHFVGSCNGECWLRFHSHCQTSEPYKNSVKLKMGGKPHIFLPPRSFTTYFTSKSAMLTYHFLLEAECNQMNNSCNSVRCIVKS